ncbi:lipid II flippase MurJ [Streptomyces sp. NPDC001852]|uniref:lipid II flippase MurJ n=1 Tax=Streptomyces sp. NPDC001852 TaxID=3364619 RepID=UPI0036B0FE54
MRPTPPVAQHQPAPPAPEPGAAHDYDLADTGATVTPPVPEPGTALGSGPADTGTAVTGTVPEPGMALGYDRADTGDAVAHLAPEPGAAHDYDLADTGATVTPPVPEPATVLGSGPADTGIAVAHPAPEPGTALGCDPADTGDAVTRTVPESGSALADTGAAGTDAAPETFPGTASGRFLAKATLISAALSVAGALLGLGRDQALAHFFGAGADTDAFLVAWTVAETAATLLIDAGMAYVLVPAFSVALARRGSVTGGRDPVRALVAASLPRLCLGLAAAALAIMAGAPLLVSLLAPSLPDASLAADCTRLTSTCVLTFGLAGYCSAALRAHGSFVAPAATSLALNIAIIATLFGLGERWGVQGAALGVALGGCLMIAVQVPSLWRRISAQPRPQPLPATDGDKERPLTPALVTSVLLFVLCRQAQVFVERYLASALPAGAISHLNYAQKVAQLPMSLSLMMCVVTFPVLARAVAEGDLRGARDRMEGDLVLVGCLVLLGTAVIEACAPQIIQLLFQHGAFTAADTAATASTMRVYALGLLGHALVGVLVRSYFSAGRATWYPLGAMAVGLIVNIVAGAWAVGFWGARGIAAANAAGITLTALLLLLGMGARSVPVCVPRVVAELAKPVWTALCAAGAGAVCARPFASPPAAVAMGCVSATAVFLVLVWALDVADTRTVLARATLTARRIVTRGMTHGR